MEIVAQIIILVCTLINAFSVGMYFGIEKGFMTVPVLQIDDKYYQFGEAVKVINELEDNK